MTIRRIAQVGATRASEFLAALMCVLLFVHVAAAQAVDAPSEDAASSILPRDLSPWGMFTSADIVVKAVMIGLAFASVVTWTVWLAKTIELVVARRRARSAVIYLGNPRTLADFQTSDGPRPRAT